MKNVIQLCAGGTWKGKTPTSAIAAYEELLGIKFPADYREFLESLGSGHKNGIEISGVDSNLSSDFNVVCRTVLQRRGYRYFPQDVIYFSDTGDGGQLYLNPKTGQVGEVFAEPPKGLSNRIISGSFLEFLEKSFG